MTFAFPEGFRWGTATAAYQIEGAATEAGRGPSIWDTFSRMPERVYAGHTGDVACDHYHRYAEDVALMRELGIGTYRFSVSWPRIKPDGTGPANPRGLDFYDRLTDELLAAGIEPMLTLYHWDLPQTLEDRGGWANRDVAHHFADYAITVHKRLGDRIGLWTTLNEPWCSAFLGYAVGVHAPGRSDVSSALAAAHHLLLAHGLATSALRAAGATTVSLTLNLAPVVPADPSDALENDAADRVDAMLNRLFLEPVFKGGYEPYALDMLERRAPGGLVRDGDQELIAQPIDLLGINYYHPCLVTARPGTPENPVYPGSDGVDFRPAMGKTTAMGWPIEPWGLTDLLERLHRDYPGVPLIITENGAAFDDVRVDGGVADHDRVAFLEGHLRACHDAISRGVDLRGYLVWSLLDNFEWAEGYRKRFGMVHVDFDTQLRTPKESALWYSKVIARNGL
ncbi:GH1 family beta-glucosidase [Allorhizocola rhizosphaerae]|uniref:GH1 family beta-glucosidase n=1 Tax=Allorhizocola rhizosphaerae TaxID=1872709 RepID=UPI000E3D8523|nr:GH1 family beta-glucosidase [Allorhizocola rhizosphaerae]